jgi:hypothetical protein
MPTLSINSTYFASLPSGWSGGSLASAAYYSTGEFGVAPYAGAPFYAEDDIDFDGVDGTATRRRGFRYRPIQATLIWVGTLSYVHAQRDANLAAFKQQNRYAIVLPDGSTFNGCKLIGDCMGQTYQNMDGKVMSIVPCLWLQKSTSN